MEHVALTASSTLGKHLRPRQAAEAMGVPLSTFWRLAKAPDFPPLIPLGPRVTVIREEELARFMERRAQQAQDARRAASEDAR